MAHPHYYDAERVVEFGLDCFGFDWLLVSSLIHMLHMYRKYITDPRIVGLGFGNAVIGVIIVLKGK